ncbi:MAG: hypothetical protein IJM15_09300 [Erysipelotrichaceae bacterium]|nr:hypothetical protein [Erysipelotrichaceae bacterium]
MRIDLIVLLLFLLCIAASDYKREYPKYSYKPRIGYYSSKLFGETDDYDSEMDEDSMHRLNDYLSKLDNRDYIEENGDFAY